MEEPEVAKIPGFATILAGSNIDWMYRMQPEQHSCRSRLGKSCPLLRGKVRVHIYVCVPIFKFLQLYTRD